MGRVHLTQLFNRYAPDVRRFLASRVTCDATAADLTQETFLRLAQLPNLAAIENVLAYLFRIAAYIATDHLRALVRRKAPSPNRKTVYWSIPIGGLRLRRCCWRRKSWRRRCRRCMNCRLCAPHLCSESLRRIASPRHCAPFRFLCFARLVKERLIGKWKMSYVNRHA